MREVRKERTVYVTIYEASDGTTFNDKDECIKYEKNARTAIIGAVKEIFKLDGENINPENYALCNCCSDDEFYAVKIQDETELAVINRWLIETQCHLPFGTDAIGKIHIFCDSWGNTYYYGTEEHCRAEQARFMDDIVRTANKRFAQDKEENE